MLGVRSRDGHRVRNKRLKAERVEAKRQAPPQPVKAKAKAKPKATQVTPGPTAGILGLYEPGQCDTTWRMLGSVSYKSVIQAAILQLGITPHQFVLLSLSFYKCTPLELVEQLKDPANVEIVLEHISWRH